MKLMPIGKSDFKQLIEGNYYYVDKTLLIKELLESAGDIILFPRPRRFGKTLNLSMLKYFFEKHENQEDNSNLFVNTAIWKNGKYNNLQGQYPVIFLTFKSIKDETWQSAYKSITEIITEEFKRHDYLLKGNIPSYDKIRYESILSQTADESLYGRSLLFLTKLLHKHYQQNVIVLIDEYDAPIHTAFNNKYYDEMVVFVRILLENVLKDNSFLHRGILTGILRVAKEGIFSGLNNIKVCSLLNFEFQDKFGFTESEIKKLLKDQKLSDKKEDVQAWYDGYTFGETKIYNPWSMIQFADSRGLLKPYWINTSDNKLIKRLISMSDEDVKSDLELLMSGQSINKEINEATIFPGIEKNSEAIWSLLLFSGYVTYNKQELIEGHTLCDLVIPNKELKFLYNELVSNIFESTLTVDKIKALLKALTQGDNESFQELLQEFIVNSISMYDFSDKDPEKSYHLFVLGLLVNLNDTYEIKSNRESGYGRYDIILIPKNTNKLGILIEFKKVRPGETLEIACKKALEQIQEKQYSHELKDRGIKNIQLLGIAFLGKQVLVQSIDL